MRKNMKKKDQKISQLIVVILFCHLPKNVINNVYSGQLDKMRSSSVGS